MSIRSLSIRVSAPAILACSALFLAVSPSSAQTQPAQPAPAAQQPQPSGSSGQTSAKKPAAATQTLPAASKQPDYPDPRTITVGAFVLSNIKSSGPDIQGGKVAADSNYYENVSNIGQPYHAIGEYEFSVPITRTGTLYAEFERYHGWADQTLGQAVYLDTYNFKAGDALHTEYHLTTGRVYLDDLLFPHAFPVSRFRLKSIWGVRYISTYQAVDSSTEDATAGLAGSSYNLGTGFILFPEFGLAGEYAIAPHVLFRVDGEGFGFPHHANLYDAAATLSVRHKNLEFLGGVKDLHFKTSPQKEIYMSGSFITPFIGIRWHWQ